MILMEVYRSAYLTISPDLNLLNIHTHAELAYLNILNTYSALYIHETKIIVNLHLPISLVLNHNYVTPGKQATFLSFGISILKFLLQVYSLSRLCTFKPFPPFY